MKIILYIVIIAAIIVLMPLAVIWSMNTLFPALAIPVTFDTWCAAIILSGAVSGSGLSIKK